MVSTAGVRVKVQVLRGQDYAPWPVERLAIEQRYSDAPPATLTVPTLSSFVAMTTAAWNDRAAPRDLYDLLALAEIGALTSDAATAFEKHGTTGHLPRPFMFANAPSQSSWRASLSGQTRLVVSAEQALHVVRGGWSRALGEE